MTQAGGAATGPGEWDAQIFVRDVLGKGPLEIELEASADQRGAIARRLGLLALDQFSAALHARHWGEGGMELSGTLKADVVQACVVSLSPVPEHLEEPVLVRFAKGVSATAPDSPDINDYDLLDPDAPDPPDPMPENGKIPVGELLIQLLSVALDPYPRSEGAKIDASVSGAGAGETAADHPFAGLAALKRPR